MNEENMESNATINQQPSEGSSKDATQQEIAELRFLVLELGRANQQNHNGNQLYQLKLPLQQRDSKSLYPLLRETQS